MWRTQRKQVWPAADGSISLSDDLPANAVLFAELKVGEL